MELVVNDYIFKLYKVMWCLSLVCSIYCILNLSWNFKFNILLLHKNKKVQFLFLKNWEEIKEDTNV